MVLDRGVNLVQGVDMPSYRQGDVSITPHLEPLPAAAKAVKPEAGGVVLAHGEVTGHSHRIPRAYQRYAKLVRTEEDRRFLRVTSPVPLRHEEHKTACGVCGVIATHYSTSFLGGETQRYSCDTHAPTEGKRLDEPGDTILAPGVYSIGIHAEYVPGELPHNVAD